MSSGALPLTLNEKSHRYTLDGRWVPGVTSIIDAGLPKPALKRWGERVVAAAAVDQLDTLGRVLQTMGRAPTIDALAATPYEQMKTAQIRGTTIHRLAELVVHGESVIVPDELAEHVRGYVAFLEAFDVEPMATETMVANRTLWYAGKFDLLAIIRDRIWMLDVKTSKNVYPETALQCAAYASAEICVVGADVVAPPKVDAIGVVHVTESGTALYDLGDIDEARQEFEACLLTYHGIRRRNRHINFDEPVAP